MTFQLRESGLMNVEPYGGSKNGRQKFVLGRGFASEESGFLIDQNVLLVSINYRFFMPKLGLNKKPINSLPDFNAYKLI